MLVAMPPRTMVLMPRRRNCKSNSVPWNAPHWRLVMMMSPALSSSSAGKSLHPDGSSAGPRRQRWLQRGTVMLKLGFIGSGNMGEGMAQNLARAGFPLTVRDLRPEPVARLVALGARCANSNFDVGQASDLVCIAVFTDEQVRQTCLPCGDDA